MTVGRRCLDVIKLVAEKCGRKVPPKHFHLAKKSILSAKNSWAKYFGLKIVIAQSTI